jgi:hypothetical protein
MHDGPHRSPALITIEVFGDDAARLQATAQALASHVTEHEAELVVLRGVIEQCASMADMVEVTAPVDVLRVIVENAAGEAADRVSDDLAVAPGDTIDLDKVSVDVSFAARLVALLLQIRDAELDHGTWSGASGDLRPAG